MTAGYLNCVFSPEHWKCSEVTFCFCNKEQLSSKVNQNPLQDWSFRQLQGLMSTSVWWGLAESAIFFFSYLVKSHPIALKDALMWRGNNWYAAVRSLDATAALVPVRELLVLSQAPFWWAGGSMTCGTGKQSQPWELSHSKVNDLQNKDYCFRF